MSECSVHGVVLCVYVIGRRRPDQRGIRARALICPTASNDLFRSYGMVKYSA